MCVSPYLFHVQACTSVHTHTPEWKRVFSSCACTLSHTHTVHTDTRTKSTYLKVSSILFYMLLDAQAQLLHPLQLGLGGGTVSLQQPNTHTEGHGLTTPVHNAPLQAQLCQRQANRRYTETTDGHQLSARHQKEACLSSNSGYIGKACPTLNCDYSGPLNNGGAGAPNPHAVGNPRVTSDSPET